MFVIIAEEVKAQSEKLERERRQNEALAARLVDMETTATRRETDLSELKRQLQAVKEEHQQVMQVRVYLLSPTFRMSFFLVKENQVGSDSLVAWNPGRTRPISFFFPRIEINTQQLRNF